MATLGDFMTDQTRQHFENIIAEEKAKEKAYWEEKERKRRLWVEQTHFKTAEEMIDWVMSGKSIYSDDGSDEMKLYPETNRVGHYGQHSDYDDCYFWYGWTTQPVEEWKKWVHEISTLEYLDYGYLPVWSKKQH